MKRLLKLSALFLALILLAGAFCSCTDMIKSVLEKGISEAKEKIEDIGQNVLPSFGEDDETSASPTRDSGASSVPETDDTPQPLADPDHDLWVAHGQYLLADGTQNGWGGKDSAVYEKSALTAITLDDVRTINRDLYNTLSGKEVKYLYTIDLLFGTNDAGWSCKFLKGGEVYAANGSYAFKVAKCTADVDGEEKIYSETQWISDPNTAYVESLTPATVFYPTWQEAADENGFSWADDPVVIGGAGLYTLVIAQYKNASAAGQPGYGAGLVLKEAKDGIAYEKIVKWIPTDHTYGVIGTFNNWGGDVVMHAYNTRTWTAEVTLNAGSEFKVRADRMWDNSWGPTDGGNYTVNEDGVYEVTISFDDKGNGDVSYSLIRTIRKEPTFGTSAWVDWLIEDDGETYNMFLTGNTYNITFPGSKLDPYDDTAYNGSPWELWPWDWDSDVPSNDHPVFEMCWMFDREEIDATPNVNTDEYEYVWEIWYRDGEVDDPGDYKVITTAPCSVYNNQSWDGVIYRIQTWNAGMKDLKLNPDGSDHEYEFVFVIYENGRKSPDNVVGWKQTWITYTNSSKAFQDHALEHGVISR